MVPKPSRGINGARRALMTAVNPEGDIGADVPPIYDCVVLSGGGAKGAYGAGAAKAIEIFRELKGISNPVCFIGASAGALNAFVLSAHDADTLIDFWRSVTKKSVLATSARATGLRVARRAASTSFGAGRPFSIYDNTALEKLVRRTVKDSSVSHPLIFVATNYTRGELEGFYVSPLIKQLVDHDRDNARRPSSRRLGHLNLIEDDEQLISALVASAAIPVFFAPVEITVERDGMRTTSWYVDGGVGNNTPTREAAYFYRFLEKMRLGRSGTVYCVTLDPARVFQQDRVPLRLLEIVRRTIEVFQVVHTKPIVEGFSRISREVNDQSRRVATTKRWLDDLPLDPGVRGAIADRITEEFDKLGGQAPRIAAPIVEIQPSRQLRDFLDFDPGTVDDDINQGFLDALAAFRRIPDPASPAVPWLDEVDHRILANRGLGRLSR